MAVPVLGRHARRGNTLAGLWWMNPAFLMIFVSLGTCLATLTFSDADFRRLWRTPKVIADEHVIQYSLLFLAYSLSVTAFLAIRPARLQARRNLTSGQVSTLLRAETVLYWLTMLGYLTFVFQAVRKGLLSAIVTSVATLDFSSGVIEDNLTTIPGLSTFTQCGVAYVVIAGTLLSMRVAGKHRRRLIVRIVLVVGAAFIRAVLLTERLAILELVVPLLPALLSFVVAGSRRYAQARIAPVVLMPLVVAVFGASEYTRSWEWYRTHGTTNFGRFVLERLAGYYVTAYNNAAIRQQHETAASLPYDTWEFFWRAPGVQNVNLYETLTGARIQQYFDNLAAYGNPEFNNQSGVSGPVMDYGFWGALGFFVLFAFVSAALYRSYREARSGGLMLYPLFFLTLLEYPRYMWVATGRAVPSLIALVLLAALLTRQRSHDLIHATGTDQIRERP